MEELKGKVALVTGGAQGIGLAIGSSLLAAGMRVVITDNDESTLEDAIASLELHERARPMKLDVSSSRNWREVINEVWDSFGGIDVLCNNAGIGLAPPPGSQPLRTWEVPEDKFRRIIDVNLLGTFHGIQATVPRMIESGRPGHLVNTASMAGFLAPPYLMAYASSKFAVVALSECLAAELQGYDIGVTILCPGGVATAFNEAARQFGSAPRASGAGGTAPRGPAASDGMKMNPAAVGERVVKAIRSKELYVFTHPEYFELVAERQNSVSASFRESAQPGYTDPAELLQRVRSPLHRPATVTDPEDRR